MGVSIWKEYIFLWFLAMALLENFMFRFQSVFCPPTSAWKNPSKKKEWFLPLPLWMSVTYKQCLVAEWLLQNMERLQLRLIAEYVIIGRVVSSSLDYSISQKYTASIFLKHRGMVLLRQSCDFLRCCLNVKLTKQQSQEIFNSVQFQWPTKDLYTNLH